MYLLSKLPIKMQAKIKVDDNGCWLWTGVMNRNGYGRFYFNGKYEMSHIHSFKLLKYVYEPGLLLDHNCRVRNCCNPTHASPVSCKVNTHRGKAILFRR